MNLQTRETGRSSAIWGKAVARLIAKKIGAKMDPLRGASPRSNLCMFGGKKAGIKTAGWGNRTFLVYKKILQVTSVTLFAIETDRNTFQVFKVQSLLVPKIGRAPSHTKHQDRAFTVSTSKVQNDGTLVGTVRLRQSAIIKGLHEAQSAGS